MAKKNDKVTFRVSNTDITLGYTYEVVPKYDADAPDGFRQWNTTKLLMRGVGETHGVTFDYSLNMWDTGFEMDSLCNSDIPEYEREVLVKAYNTHIKLPFEKKFRKDLSPVDTEDDKGFSTSFWSTFGVEIYKGRTFDTSNVKELLELFVILKHFKVCEKGEKSYLAREAKYNIINKEKLTSLKDTRNAEKLEAIAKFHVMLNSDKETLFTVLEWLNFGSVRNSEDITLQNIVMDYFENPDYGHQNISNFLETYKMTESESRKEEMEMFSLLNKMNNRRLFKYERKEYTLNGDPIGNSLKDIAARCLKDPELRKDVIAAADKAKLLD